MKDYKIQKESGKMYTNYFENEGKVKISFYVEFENANSEETILKSVELSKKLFEYNFKGKESGFYDCISAVPSMEMDEEGTSIVVDFSYCKNVGYYFEIENNQLYDVVVEDFNIYKEVTQELKKILNELEPNLYVDIYDIEENIKRSEQISEHILVNFYAKDTEPYIDCDDYDEARFRKKVFTNERSV